MQEFEEYGEKVREYDSFWEARKAAESYLNGYKLNTDMSDEMTLCLAILYSCDIEDNGEGWDTEDLTRLLSLVVFMLGSGLLHQRTLHFIEELIKE